MYSGKEASILCAKGQTDLSSINALFVCDEWKSLKGGLTTFNRELAVNLALSKNINVFCYVTQSDEEDRKDASKHGVNLITAQRIPGSTDPLDHLKIPPLPIDIVIGHGRKFGNSAYFIAERTKCKWIQIVHVFCEDLGKYKKAKQSTVDTIDENENKHKLEIQLCEAADVVVGVGSGLQYKYKKCLPGTDVKVLTPGIFESFANLPVRLLPEPGFLDERSLIAADDFNVYVFGRVTSEDLFVKGYDIIGKAIATLAERFKLTCVGSRRGKQRETEKWFLEKTGIKREQLTIRRYCNQEDLKRMLHEADLVVLPSRAEGFGLAALEAISAAIPVLISRHSGIALTLQKVEGGDSVIVANQGPEEWARRIEELSRQAPKERSDNASHLREKYRKVYPWSIERERFKEIIENLFQAAKTGPNKENDPKLSQDDQKSDERVTHGMGKQPLSAAKATENLQNKRRKLENCDEAAVLQWQVWWDLLQLFHIRNHESHGLKWGDISLEKDPRTDNERLVLKAEHSSKPRQVFLPVAQTSTDPGTSQSPVKTYKEFRSHWPEEMKQPDSPFYLAVKEKRRPGDTVWYMKRPLAIKKIGKLP